MNTNIKILNENEKAEIENYLNINYGIKNIPGLLIKFGSEKLFLFTGNIMQNEIKKIMGNIPIEKIGVYFAKIIDDDFKLSIEGTQILKEQIKENIFELDDKQTEEWLKGHDLQIESEKHGYLIMKHDCDFLGSGKASLKKISNFIPKSRRIKEKN